MQARAGEWRMATKEETYNALTAEKNGGVKERGKNFFKKKEGKKKNVY